MVAEEHERATVALVWAMAENRAIGLDGHLPWRLPNEMRHFMRVTRGKPVVMGRRTFDSMKRPLAGRTNIVVTSRPLSVPGVLVTASLAEALQLADAQAKSQQQAEVMVIGGAGIYADALPSADRLYMTIVHAKPDADVFFAEFDLADWRESRRQYHPADEDHALSFTMYQLERR